MKMVHMNIKKWQIIGVDLSGDSTWGPGWAMAYPDFWLAPCLAPQFFLNFLFKFVWLTYTVDNFRPAIFCDNLETL